MDIEDEKPITNKEKRDWHMRRIERDLKGESLRKFDNINDFPAPDFREVKKTNKRNELVKKTFLHYNKSGWKLTGDRVLDPFKGFVTIAKLTPDGKTDWDSETKVEFKTWFEYRSWLKGFNLLSNLEKVYDTK